MDNESNNTSKESHSSASMAQGCNCNESDRDAHVTQNTTTAAAQFLLDATTSTCGLEELQENQKSRDESNMQASNFITFNNLDEFMNILFSETEESERLFALQATETLRCHFVLMEHTEKMNNLNLLLQSTASAIEKCEINLLCISHTQSLLESWVVPVLELYLLCNTTLPTDERGLLYNQMLSVSEMREILMIASVDINEMSPAQNEDHEHTIELQILQILNCHYEMLCKAQSKIDTIKQTVEDIQECYKFFCAKYPWALLYIPEKHSQDNMETPAV